MAQLVDNLCQRYSCRPSELREENAHDMLQTLAILALAIPQDASSTVPGQQTTVVGRDGKRQQITSSGIPSNPDQIHDDMDFTNWDHGFRRMNDGS